MKLDFVFPSPLRSHANLRDRDTINLYPLKQDEHCCVGVELPAAADADAVWTRHVGNSLSWWHCIIYYLHGSDATTLNYILLAGTSRAIQPPMQISTARLLHCDSSRSQAWDRASLRPCADSQPRRRTSYFISRSTCVGGSGCCGSCVVLYRIWIKCSRC